MKFAYPEFLYALFAIAIPIIIHLFNFRKFKKIYFSNVEFLKEVQQETQAKSKLKHLLILLSRILAITFLVFAFAQPYLPSITNNITQNNAVGLYIDNSFSMESTGENGTLLDEAKEKALTIVNAYLPTDKFTLITNQFSAGDQRLLSKEEVIEKIEAVTISPSTKTISNVYSRNNSALNNAQSANKNFYLLSDFQATISDFEKITVDTSINTYLTPITTSKTSNLYIDSCWFSSPTHLLFQQETLAVNIKNNGEDDLENIPLKLYINNQLITPTTFSIKANESKVVFLNYTNKSKGIQRGKIELKDAPVTTDDVFYFTYAIAENINILSIENEKGQTAITAVYQTDSIFNFVQHNLNQLDYSLIKKSNLVILHHLKEMNTGLANAIKQFVDEGGSLLVFPAPEIDIDSYREFLSLMNVNYYTATDTMATKVRTIHYKHPIFKNVFDEQPKGNIDLPQVTKHYILSKNTTSFKTEVLTLKNDDPFLTSYKVNKGNIYLSTVALDKTNSTFSKHALFVPILYNIALLSQTNYPLFFTIGQNVTIDVPSFQENNLYHITNTNFDIIPPAKNTNNGTNIFINSAVELAGNYVLENEQFKTGLAYNYNRLESDLTTLSSEEIQHQITINSINAKIIDNTSGNIKSALIELNTGKRYWKYCIILALLFLAIEIALIKLLKT
ncbi:MAG: BatA domain-containing protein [Vicingus serpentipes]|nr:BatA domain-containing protein [Vicingus serpentipes]